MSFKAGDQVPAGGGEKAAGEPKFDSPAEMIAFTSGYFASDFPNPGRAGCPESGTIGEIVRSGKQPDAQLRAHLFGCSECFVEFDREMRARGDVRPAPASRWSKLPGVPSLRPAPLLAGALCLLLIALAGVYLRRVYQRRITPVITDSQPSPVSIPPDEAPKSNVTTSATPRVSPPQDAPVVRVEKLPRPRPRATQLDAGPLVVVETVKVDLEEYVALRGGGGTEKVIRLSRSPTRLELTLPEGSVEGLYDLSILDPSGKALVTAKARSADGKTLNATLDASKLAPRKYRLRLLREGEAPQFYPVIVVEGTKSAPRVRDP